jgi:hypothetical protein
VLMEPRSSNASSEGPTGRKQAYQPLNDGLDSQTGDLAPLQPERGRRERVRGVWEAGASHSVRYTASAAVQVGQHSCFDGSLGESTVLLVI